MMMTSTETEVSSLRFAIKGSAFRGYTGILKRDGRFDEVCARVTPATASILRNPLPSTAWVDFEALRDLAVVIGTLYGTDYWSQVGYESTRDSIIPLMRLMIEGVLRLFGASPHTLLSRVGDSTNLTTRGLQVKYLRMGDNAGEITMHYPAHPNLPDVIILGSARSVLQISCELCGKYATWDPPTRLTGQPGTAFTYRVRWT